MSNLMLTKNGNIIKRNQFNSGGVPAWDSFIDDLFGDQLGHVKNKNYNKISTSPKVNIQESDEGYTLSIAVPGYKKSDFIIDLENETLTISAELKTEENKKDIHYSRKEFEYTSFKRSFTLPETIEVDKIEANYTDGILSLTIPKKEEAKPKPARSISVK